MLILRPELLRTLQTPAGLPAALQQAIQLEHATIPPYLYALYSLAPGTNTGIAALISSVVAEEMAHLALACNLLNAIGGHPVLDDPAFVPTYPGPLPGTVDSGLVVGLAPFSTALVQDVFMGIEEPDRPIVIPAATVPPVPRPPRPLTIGLFYGQILRQLEAAGESVFTGPPSSQVSHGYAAAEVIPVVDLSSARRAITTIVEQGEGTRTSPLDALAAGEVAHYYRFEEIVRGFELVADPGGAPPWRFAGPPIACDPAGVLPVVTNPKLASYQDGSAARYGCRAFNYTYTSLLKVLHATFNGEPGRLRAAIGLMESLNEQAQTLMTTPSGLPGGGNAGPSFEYQPTN